MTNTTFTIDDESNESLTPKKEDSSIRLVLHGTAVSLFQTNCIKNIN